MFELFRVGLFVVFWCLAGLIIVGFAFHTADVQWGRILLSVGMLVGYAGMVVTLGRAHLRAEARGDL